MYGTIDKRNNNTKSKRKHKIIGTVIKVNGRAVGQVINGEYVKDITNRHMLTTPPAIANDLQALHDAERAGAWCCVFTNTDTGIIYRAAIAKIWDAGWLMNLGYGNQQALTLSYWLQSVDPEFTIHTDTDAQEYATSDTHEPPAYSMTFDGADVKPLHYKSNALVGVKFTKGVKQLSLFGGAK